MKARVLPSPTQIDIYKKELHSYKKEYEKVVSSVEEQEQANQLFA